MIDSNETSLYRNWEYANLGDYHRNLDLNWSYAPTYLQKVKLVYEFINSLPKNNKILDVGCGEGVFVEDFSKQGRNIKGLDFNYESEFVQRGDVRKIPYDDCSLDAVLFLDALEHLAFIDQPTALSEIYRILKPEGILFLSVPNLAHLNSRYSLLFQGKLDRTDAVIDHVGERPFWENKQIIQETGFKIINIQGVTLTLPIIYRKLICKKAKKLRWLHDLFEPLARIMPSLAMLTFFVCKK